jgi:alpha-mannosidase/mannosylglycerate hydrolase
MSERRRAYYVLSTHWDREWHQPFQDFRYRLVRLMDQVLDGLADGRLAGPFTTDGQAILLEDYLEIRPERRGQVEQFLREGRIAAGPWYVLPDEFLVGGESLVRNLRLGRELVRSLGGTPSSAGVLADLFGHNSQMPQLFKAFGATGILLWRGVNLMDRRHLLWRGADGTELPAYKFGCRGYCDFAAAVRRIAAPDAQFDARQAAQRLEQYLAAEAALSEVDPILAYDGADHQFWDQAVYQVLRDRIERPDGPFELVHGTLDQYLAEVVQQADRISARREGELREPGRAAPEAQDAVWLIAGVASSRVWIHQANANCEALLTQWAEPWSAFASAALGAEYPAGFLAVAWKWLLQNHPHDSICGCSIDQVHEDMKYRFSQCRRIAERLTSEATRALAANVEGEVGPDELRVVVFNPLPEPFRQTAELVLGIPEAWPRFSEFFGFEPKPAFRVYDAAGQQVPYQRLGQAMGRTKARLHDARFPETYRTDDVTVSLPLAIPACGYATFRVRRGEAGVPTRHPDRPGMATSGRSMENELLAVSIEAGGTLSLTDKRTHQTYSRLLTWEDCADIGDGWYHGAAVNDQVFVSAACAADVALVHDGPMLTCFRICTRMRLPEEFDFQRMVRGDRMVEMAVESLVSLRPASDCVEVLTTLRNPAADHRLRLLLPSGVDAESYLCDTPFDVVERPIALRADNAEYRELEVETRPQQSWTALADGKRGLAVVACGLLEATVRDLPERPIALTLFRSTRRTVFSDGEPEGLLLGQPLSFRYLLVPLAACSAGVPPAGGIDRARLCRLGQRLAAGLRNVQLTAKDVDAHRTGRALPPVAGFLCVDGPVVVTSFRQVGAALETRLFNPNGEAVRAAIRFGQQPADAIHPASAQPVDLESQPAGEATAIRDAVLSLGLRAKQILTLRFDHGKRRRRE